MIHLFEFDYIKCRSRKLRNCNLIDMFNDTSRYLDDIFTIDNPEFEKQIPDIYPTELQLNKANTSDKETSFLDLNIKVIGSDVYRYQRLRQTRLLRISYRQFPQVEW